MKRRQHRKPTHLTRIYVGLDKGRTTGHCRTAPATFTPAAVDKFVVSERRRQGITSPSTTRLLAKGVYKGASEPSVIYELYWFRGSKYNEKNYIDFRRHTNRIAQDIARAFCQRSVLISHVTPGKKTARLVTPRTRRV